MRYFFDWEFHEHKDGTIDPISLGMVSEDGRDLYLEMQFDEEAARAEPFLRENVLPLLSWRAEDRLTVAQARAAVEDFCRPTMAIPRGGKPEFWGWFAATDWVLLYRLWGRMIDLPQWMPHCVMDVRQWWQHMGYPSCRPNKPETAHNALADALWTRDFYQAIRKLVSR